MMLKVFKGKKEAPNSGEPVCVLCRRTQVNPDICGETFTSGGLCAHQFCLFFADGLLEWRTPMGGIFGFSLHAVQRAVQLADQKRCFVCDKGGATISCAETGCERSFHLPCAEDGECVTQYFGQHRSFCWEHRPRQAVEAAPSQNTTCVICLEPVGDSTSYHTMMCPECKQAWFHRGCIRKHALHAATMCFFCPVCGGRVKFRSKMTMLGIQIPVRRPSWWDDEAYQPLRERHRRCDARMCLYLGGRERAQEAGPWQLLLCSSCGSEGTHRYCTFGSTGGHSWECNTCTGVGSASRTNSELASSSSSSLEVPVPSFNITGLENTSSGPARQAASSPPSQQCRGRGGRRRAPAAGAETCSQSLTRQGPARSCRRSSVPVPTKHPRQQGTSRTRSRSPLQGRASGSQAEPQRQRGRSRTRARGAQSRSRSSQPQRQRGRSRTRARGARSRSRSSQPQRQRGRSRTRARGARSRSRSSQPQRQRGRSRTRARGARSRSRSSQPQRQRGRSRTRARGARSRSRSSQPQRQRGRSRTRARGAQSRSRSSQPQRQRGRSRTRARGAQSRSRTSATPAPSRSSRASPLPARRRQSRQRGRAKTRSRSPVRRRASSSRSRSQGGRGSRSRQRGPARTQSRSRANHQRKRSRRRR